MAKKKIKKAPEGMELDRQGNPIPKKKPSTKEELEFFK